jgi:hypothetical protein
VSNDAYNKFRSRVAELQSQLNRGTARPTVGRRDVAFTQSRARPPEVATRFPAVGTETKPRDAAGQLTPTAGPAAPFTLPGPGTTPSVTLSRKMLERDAKLERKKLGPLERPVDVVRPKTRGDCYGGERPCPHVGCRYHTYLEVTAAGSLVINRPDVDVDELKASCVLDIADAGPITLEKVGDVFNVTRERARQLEAAAIVSAERAFKADEVKSFRGSCKAVCALSGRRCQLPAHNQEVRHRHERGSFHLVALPDQVHFPERERLERAATAQNDEGLFHAR